MRLLFPFSRSGVGAPVIGEIDGEYRHDSRRNLLEWCLPVIDAKNKSGSLEFSIAGQPNDFFPVQVSFISKKNYCNIQVWSPGSRAHRGMLADCAVAAIRLSVCACATCLPLSLMFFSCAVVFRRARPPWTVSSLQCCDLLLCLRSLCLRLPLPLPVRVRADSTSIWLLQGLSASQSEFYFCHATSASSGQRLS